MPMKANDYVKVFTRDWLCGLQLLLKFLIVLVCLTAGETFVLGPQIVLSALGIHVPVGVMLVVQMLYFVVLCPLIVASYARRFGFGSTKTDVVTS